MTAPSLRPAEAWALRLDEAVMMLASRASLMNQGRRAEGEKRYTERPDGSREYRIDSIPKLQQFLATGMV